MIRYNLENINKGETWKVQNHSPYERFIIINFSYDGTVYPTAFPISLEYI